jgi:hypothetical protein
MLLLLLAGSGYVGSAACTPCHAAISRSYSQTAMARTSGVIQTEIPTGVVHHLPSGMSYRIESRNQSAFFEYSSSADAPMPGRQQIHAYIGSGVVGRSYLFQIEGWWFLAPVAYYSQKGAWDVSPGYEPDRQMHFSRRVTER